MIDWRGRHIASGDSAVTCLTAIGDGHVARWVSSNTAAYLLRMDLNVHRGWAECSWAASDAPSSPSCFSAKTAIFCSTDGSITTAGAHGGGQVSRTDSTRNSDYCERQRRELPEHLSRAQPLLLQQWWLD
jgi:hypothetical protein